MNRVKEHNNRRELRRHAGLQHRRRLRVIAVLEVAQRHHSPVAVRPEHMQIVTTAHHNWVPVVIDRSERLGVEPERSRRKLKR